MVRAYFLVDASSYLKTVTGNDTPLDSVLFVDREYMDIRFLPNTQQKIDELEKDLRNK